MLGEIIAVAKSTLLCFLGAAGRLFERLLRSAPATIVAGVVRAKPELEHQIDPDDGEPYERVYDPRKWLRTGEKNMGVRLQRAFEELGSNGPSPAGWRRLDSQRKEV